MAEVVQASTSAARAWLAILAFIWLALVYVIVAFVDITASTFVGKTEDLAGRRRPALQPRRRGRLAGSCTSGWPW